jgi:hypothetical protein
MKDESPQHFSLSLAIRRGLNNSNDPTRLSDLHMWEELSRVMNAEEMAAILGIAAAQGLDHDIRSLVAQGAELNRRDASRATSVCKAAEYGRAGSIRVLHELGADINHRYLGGESPAYVAAYNGHEECIRVLHELGADINQYNNYTESPLSTPARILLVLLATRTAIDSAATYAASMAKPINAKLMLEAMNLLTSRADLQDLRNLRMVC